MVPCYMTVSYANEMTNQPKNIMSMRVLSMGGYLTLIIVWIIAHANPMAALIFDADSNISLDVLQLASKYGYPAEKYKIVTEDGYILQMERIPYGRKNVEVEHRPAVLLVPGLLTGSVTYANLGPDRSLAFILADSGYDVWLLNYRGTTYSRKHVSLNANVDRKKYWNFSFVEIGAYDIPAAIDKILSSTNQDSLFYIGHSLGNSDLFALLAERPEYNQKVKLMIALAPVLQLNNTKNNIFTPVGIFHNKIQAYADLSHSYEVLPHSPLITLLGRIFCRDGSVFQIFCVAVFLTAGGYSPDQLDKTQLPVIISTTPAGSSLKSIFHSSQLYKTGRFAKYDYGKDENMIRYGQSLPPLYNVSKITTPIAIFYGGKDALISVQDIEDDAKMLPSLHSKTLIKPFNHLDFIWGIDAPSLVYSHITNIMNSFRNAII